MFTLLGRPQRYCDGISRRSFLRVGSLALGGLSLPHLLRAEQKTGKSQRSVIMVYLTGGLAHQDTFDLKPNAPAEVRGEFKPIATNVPGIQISEHLPRLAACADKYALVRSIVGLADEHSSFQNTTGFGMNTTKREGKPHFGSVIARVQGPADPVVPPFVDLFPVMQHKPYNSPGAGYLGRAATPVRLDGSDLAAMKLQDTTTGELADRRRLLEQVDAARRTVERGRPRRDGHLLSARLRRADLVEAGRGAGRDQGAGKGARPLRPRFDQTSRRRGADVERSAADGAPAG